MIFINELKSYDRHIFDNQEITVFYGGNLWNEQLAIIFF